MADQTLLAKARKSRFDDLPNFFGRPSEDVERFSNSIKNITKANDELDTTVKHTEKEELSEQERKKIHNRSCTLKQRKRLYKYEIICRNIDRRFTITNIKNILRKNSIEFCAINIVHSSSNLISLYIGIENPEQLSKYEAQTKHLFSTENYYRLYRNQHQLNCNDHRHRYLNHH